METFEIKREDDGTSLGKFRARPQGKLVSEVLKNMKKKLGHDGILLDDTTELTDTDLLTPGHIYKFRRSIHIDAPSALGEDQSTVNKHWTTSPNLINYSTLNGQHSGTMYSHLSMFCKLPQQVKEVADEFESPRAKKPKLFNEIDDTKLRVHHQQASESLTRYMSEPGVTNSLQNELQSPPSVVLPVMVAGCKILVEEYFSKGIFEFKVRELKECYKMRFGYRLDEKAEGYEGIDEFLQHVMPGGGLRSVFKGPEKFITCDTKCLNQNFLKKHPGIITKQEVRKWLENLVLSGRASLGIDLSCIRHDFEKLTSKPLDYKSLHHGSLMKLLLEFRDLVRIERCGSRTMVFPQHGAKLMYKKPQVRVVNNMPTIQHESFIKPGGINYIRPRKNVLLMKQTKPEVPRVPPGNFLVPYKLQMPVEDPICSTIAMAIPRSSILEELVQPVEVVANCRSSDPSSKVAAARLKAHEINGGETIVWTSNLTDPIRSMVMPRSSIFEEFVKPVKIVPNCRISPDSSGAHLKTHENCSEKATLPCNLTDPIIPSMAMPRSSLVEEAMQPVKVVANYRSSDSSEVLAHLKTHENCSGRSAVPSGSLNVTECRANVEVMPTCIHEPQNPPFSPSPTSNTLEAAASAKDSLKGLREREEIRITLQSISHVLTTLDKDRERIRRLNIATNTAIKKKMASSGLACGALLEDSGGEEFNLSNKMLKQGRERGKD